MHMPTEQPPASVVEVVREAVTACGFTVSDAGIPLGALQPMLWTLATEVAYLRRVTDDIAGTLQRSEAAARAELAALQDRLQTVVEVAAAQALTEFDRLEATQAQLAEAQATISRLTEGRYWPTAADTER